MLPSDYAVAGFRPIRLYGVKTDGSCTCYLGATCGAPGKHPIDTGWHKKATADEFAVRELFAGHTGNIGIAISPGYVAVDCDGAEALATFAAFQAPETLSQSSGRGAHYLFKLLPHHKPLANARGVLPGIDLRGDGGQIVVEPSMHATGVKYQWDNWGVPIANLPENIYQAIKPKTPVSSNVVSIHAGTDRLGRARKYVEKMPPAISGQGGHDATFAVARKLVQDCELSDSEAWSVLCEFNQRCVPPWSEKELQHKLKSAQKARVANPWQDRAVVPYRSSVAVAIEMAPVVNWMQGLQYIQVKGRSKLVTNHANCVHMLLHCPEFVGRIRRNELSNAVEYFEFPFREQEGASRSGEWNDNDTFCLMSRLAAFEVDNVIRPDFKRDVVDAAVETVATMQSYHPVRDYLDGLKWDGTPRINAWLARYLGTPGNAWDRIVGERFLVSAVARAFSPGCKVDTVLILEGGQGAGKSTAIRTLFGNAWFSDTPIDFGSKDGYQGLGGKWCLELGELSTFTRRDLNTLKNFFSALVDDYRPSYGRRNVKFPRQCVFVGSTNQTTYLDDETGNRRYWPVTVGKILLSDLDADRDQLWAEAVATYRAGSRWWLTEEEEGLGTAPRAARLHEDSWLPEVARFLIGKSSCSVAQALRGLELDHARWGRAEEMRIAKCFRALGWIRCRSGGSWVYQPDPTIQPPARF